MLLAAHLLVITENFTKIQNFKRLAAFIGIVPYQNKSGALYLKGLKFATLDLCQAVNSCGWLLNR